MSEPIPQFCPFGCGTRLFAGPWPPGHGDTVCEWVEDDPQHTHCRPHDCSEQMRRMRELVIEQLMAMYPADGTILDARAHAKWILAHRGKRTEEM